MGTENKSRERWELPEGELEESILVAASGLEPLTYGL